MRRSVIAVTTITLVAGPLAAQEAVREGQAVSLDARLIEIYDIAGHVTMHRGSGSGVQVTAHTSGRDGRIFSFAVNRGSDRATFVTQVPDSVDRISSPDSDWDHSTVRIRSDGTFGGDDGGRWTRRGGGSHSIDIGGRRGADAAADLDIAVGRGATVKLHLVAGSATIDGVEGDVVIDTWGATAKASNITGSWLFDTGSGGVEVHNANGTLKLDTGSGSGTVVGVRGDLLDLDTGSGDVDVTDVQVARCRFDTGSGEVHARNMQAPRCSVDTGSGEVTLVFTGGAIDDLNIDTGSGGVDLTLPPNADVRINADPGSGGVNVVRAGGLLERRSGDELVMRWGQGTGHVKIDTGSGGVTIR